MQHNYIGGIYFMENILNGFIQEMIQDGKSESTIKAYTQHIKGYMKWFKETKHTELTEVLEDNLNEYKNYLLTVKGNKPTSVHPKIVALGKFSAHLHDAGLSHSAVRVSKVQVKMVQQVNSPTEITKDNVEHLRQQVLETGNYRNYTIITLMAYAGLRISEVLSLKVSDINFTTQEISVYGKGGKYRTVLYGVKLKTVLESYVNEHRNVDSDLLFVSREGNQINRTVINKLFNEYSTHRTLNFKKKNSGKGNLKKSQHFEEVDTLTQSDTINNLTDNKPDLPFYNEEFTFSPITPHDLRHFYCTYALEVGYDIHEVANQAGHTSVNTTMRYLNPTKKQILAKANLM